MKKNDGALNESLVINKNFFNLMENDLTCTICMCLLNDPLMCTGCETPFCRKCIENWKTKNDSCPSRCKPFLLKDISKTLKSLLDRVFLKCKNGCSVSLLEFPKHQDTCNPENKEIKCFNCDSKLINTTQIKMSENQFLNLQIQLDELSILNTENQKEIKKKSDKFKLYEDNIRGLEKKITLLEKSLEDSNNELQKKDDMIKKFNLEKHEIEERYKKDLQRKDEEIYCKLKEFEKSVNNHEISALIEKSISSKFQNNAFKNDDKIFQSLETFMSYQSRYFDDSVNCVTSISIQDQLIIAAGCGNNIFLFELPNEKKFISILKSHTKQVNCLISVTLNNKANLISGGSDNNIKIWDIVNETVIANLYGHFMPIRALSMIHIKNQVFLISGCDDESIKLWNPDIKKLVHNFLGHKGEVLCLVPMKILNQIYFVSGGADSTVRMWDPSQNILIKSLTGHEDKVFCLTSLLIDNKIIITSGSGDKTIKFWNMIKGISLFTLSGHTKAVRSLISIKLNDEMAVISGSNDESIQIWNINKKTNVQTLFEHKGEINFLHTMIISDQVNFISASSDKTIKVWK